MVWLVAQEVFARQFVFEQSVRLVLVAQLGRVAHLVSLLLTGTFVLLTFVLAAARLVDQADIEPVMMAPAMAVDRRSHQTAVAVWRWAQLVLVPLPVWAGRNPVVLASPDQSGADPVALALSVQFGAVPA